MKLTELYIDGFGKLRNLSLCFSDGYHVLYGKNEAGKSTLHSFLQAMLYGLRRSSGGRGTDPQRRFQPWDGKEGYGGTLRFTYQGSHYLLRRDFRKDGEPVFLKNESSGMVLSDPEQFLQEVLGGISEAAFTGTVSIGQLRSSTGYEMVRELQQYIQSLESTGNAELNAESALQLLSDEKKALKSRLLPDAARNYASLIGEIRNIEREISAPQFENRLEEYTSLRNNIREEERGRRPRQEALLQITAREQAILEQADCQNEQDLLMTGQTAEAMYSDLKAATGYLAAPRHRLLAAGSLLLFLMLSALGGLLTAQSLGHSWFSELLPNTFSRLSADFPFFQLSIVCYLLALCLLLYALATFGNLRQSREHLLLVQEELRILLARHLGGGEPSEESMAALRSRFAELHTVIESLSQHEAELAKLQEELSRLSTEESGYEEELLRQHGIQTELEGRLEHLSNLKDRAEHLEKGLSENERIRERLDALELASDTIRELSERIRKSFGHYLNKKTGELLSGITGHAYDSLWIDDFLNITLITNGEQIPLESVSSGTMDQVYLSLRLAAALLLQESSKELLPLLFDESFAMYDEERLRTTLSALERVYGGQLLLFTCHTRELQILRELGKDFRLIEL